MEITLNLFADLDLTLLVFISSFMIFELVNLEDLIGLSFWIDLFKIGFSLAVKHKIWYT